MFKYIFAIFKYALIIFSVVVGFVIIINMFQGSSKNSEKVRKEIEIEALVLCQVLKVGFPTTECDANFGTRTVNAVIIVDSVEAGEICQALVESGATTFRKSGKEWRLRITSPSSGDDVLAVCTLL